MIFVFYRNISTTDQHSPFTLPSSALFLLSAPCVRQRSLSLSIPVTVATLTDLGFLWFREFYLESSRVIQVLGIRWSSIFYIESIARVRRLSLSGLLLYKLWMADQLFVQWPQLQQQYPRATYVGRLM